MGVDRPIFGNVGQNNRVTSGEVKGDITTLEASGLITKWKEKGEV
jgi:hypothetical protein